MASSVASATSDTPTRNYASPATSLGIYEGPQTTFNGSNDVNARDVLGLSSLQDRPLPMPPAYEHLGSFTYRELAKTRALLKKRAADASMMMSPGYFDDVIAHMDRLMQPSTDRIQESAPRAVSTPIQLSDSVRSKDELAQLLKRGPYSLRSASEPVPNGTYLSLRPNDFDSRVTVRIVDDDEKPISPTKPLTIRKKSSSSTPSTEVAARHNSKERSDYDGEVKPYDRLRSGERRSAGSSLLESSLEPIREDEDKENRNPGGRKASSGEWKKKAWFRRHEPVKRSEVGDQGPPPPPKDHLSNRERAHVAWLRETKARKRVSDAPSDESQGSDTKKGLSGTAKFFKIFGKRNSKEMKNAGASTVGGRLLSVVREEEGQRRLTIRLILDYNLNDADSINSTASSQTRHAYMSGALHDLSAPDGSRPKHVQPARAGTRTAPPAPRQIQPQHQNWLARFLRIKPAESILCFQISRIRARKEITGVFREWRKYGMRDIAIDKAAGRIWARVAEKNCTFAFLHPLL